MISKTHITQHKMYKMCFSNRYLVTLVDKHIRQLLPLRPALPTNSLLLETSHRQDISHYELYHPSVCSVTSQLSTHPSKSTNLMLTALSIAKKTILLNWKTRSTLNETLDLLSESLLLLSHISSYFYFSSFYLFVFHYNHFSISSVTLVISLLSPHPSFSSICLTVSSSLSVCLTICLSKYVQ